MNSKSKEYLLIDYSKSNNIYGVAELLLNDTINVNYANKDGYTALMIANTWGYSECVELLLKHPNINANYATKIDGWTALHFAAIGKYYPKVIIDLLLKHPNINPLQQDIYGTCYFDLNQFYFELYIKKKNKLIIKKE